MRIDPLASASLGVSRKPQVTLKKALVTALAAAASFERVQGSPVSGAKPAIALRAPQSAFCVVAVSSKISTLANCAATDLPAVISSVVSGGLAARAPNYQQCPAPHSTTTVSETCTKTSMVTTATATHTVTVPGRDFVTTVHPTITRTVNTDTTSTLTVTTTLNAESDVTATATTDTTTVSVTGTYTVTTTTLTEVTSTETDTATVTETDTETDTITVTPAAVTVTVTSTTTN